MNNIDNKILNEIVDRISNSVLYRIKKRNVCENNLIRELSPHCEIIDEYITHNFHSDKFFMIESNGLFNDYNNIINNLYDDIVQEYNKTTPTVNELGFKCWNFILKKDYTDNLHLFFKAVEIDTSLIEIPLKQIDYIEKLVNGSCSGDINIENNKIEKIKIKIVCPFVKNEHNKFESVVKSTLAHELTHAYQDLHQHIKKQNGKKVMTNKEYADSVYNNYINLTKSSNDIEKWIGTIFYHLSKSEQNAKVAQTYNSLVKFTTKELRNSKIIDIIKQLPMWNEFLIVDEMLDDIYYYSNYDGYDTIILNAINKCCYNIQFKTIDKALSWIDDEYRRAKKNIITKIGMIIKRYLRDNPYYPIQPKNNSFI